MRALVTGGAGFIGRWVVDRLLDEGARVLVVDDLRAGRRANLEAIERRPGFLGLAEFDVRDPSRLAAVFEGEPWDLVLHLAADVNVQRSIDEPAPTVRNDFDGTLAVLEGCRHQYFRLNGLDPAKRPFSGGPPAGALRDRRPRFTLVSTCMVYAAAPEGAIAETHEVRAASPYAASKLAAEALVRSYGHAYGMPVTVARPFNTYGPWQRADAEGGVVAIFLKRALRGERPLVKGDGRQNRDLLYVEDCADFIVRLSRCEGAEGQIVNAGTGRVVEIGDLAKRIAGEFDYVPHDHPQAEIRNLRCDAGKARELLGWEARTTLEEGLHRTRLWLEENRWAW